MGLPNGREKLKVISRERVIRALYPMTLSIECCEEKKIETENVLN